MSGGGFAILRARSIAGHSIYLAQVAAEDGSEIHEIIVDCVVQCAGTLRKCEGQWRQWVRSLSKIAQKRDCKIA